MPITKDRLLALVVTIANGVLGAWLGSFSQSHVQEAGFAILLSLPGLAIIWLREILQDRDLAFPRGLPAESPPVLLAIIGWLFLLVIPMLYVYKLSEHLK